MIPQKGQVTGGKKKASYKFQDKRSHHTGGSTRLVPEAVRRKHSPEHLLGFLWLDQARGNSLGFTVGIVWGYSSVYLVPGPVLI